MKKAVVAVLAVGIIGAGGYGAYYYYSEIRGGGSAERVSSDSADAVYVDQVSLITGYGSGSGFINRYGGEVEPQSTLEVKLESERTVKECYVKEGDQVKEGQRLFTYDTQDDEDKLAQAEIDIEKAQSDIDISKKAVEQYEKERAKASADEQLSYTTQILTAQNDIKQNEYSIKTKELEISSLKDSIANATVTAEMAGTVQKISDPEDSSSSGYYGSSESSAYITILSDGDFRVKGSLNEQNMGQIGVGTRMIIYSRVDNSQTWTGEVSEIKTEPEEDNDNSYYYSSDSAGSSNYPFYVELDSSEGLLLGQHVYMEPDMGQSEVKDGLWLEEYYITQEDGAAYVWCAGSKNVIEKREVHLGEYDEDTMEYEITEGLDAEDYITMPQDSVYEGAPVIYNDYDSSDGLGAFSLDGMDYSDDSWDLEDWDEDSSVWEDSGDDLTDLDGDWEDSGDDLTDLDGDWEDSDEDWEDGDSGDGDGEEAAYSDEELDAMEFSSENGEEWEDYEEYTEYYTESYTEYLEEDGWEEDPDGSLSAEDGENFVDLDAQDGEPMEDGLQVYPGGEE